jgi:hypothetical protein
VAECETILDEKDNLNKSSPYLIKKWGRYNKPKLLHGGFGTFYYCVVAE